MLQIKVLLVLELPSRINKIIIKFKNYDFMNFIGMDENYCDTHKTPKIHALRPGNFPVWNILHIINKKKIYAKKLKINFSY